MKKFFSILLFLMLSSHLVQAQTLPSRLVSLKPNITQSLVELGLGNKVVGVTKYCDRPNASAEIVGDYNHFDVEKIVRLKPDLVITSSENASRREFAQLSDLKIPSLLLHFDTWRDLLVSLDELERKLKIPSQQPLSGKPTLSARLSQDLTEIRRQAAALKGKSFVVIVQRVPLMVAGGKSFIGTLLSQVGLNNIFAEAPTAYPTIDEEIFIREGPDLVFELSHEESPEPEFLGQKIIPLKMQDYLASPRVTKSLEQMIQRLLMKK